MAKYRKPMALRLPKLHLALPADVYRANRYRYPHDTDQEAMRSDWEKIGADFQVSMTQAQSDAAAE